jgi:acid phosphatase
MAWTRRTLLLVALGSACLGCGLRGERVRGLRILPQALEPPPAIGDAEPSISFCAFGDWGQKSQTLSDVVATLRATGHARESDFILLLGDNFYDDGIRSTRDRRWARSFESAFPGEGFDLPFHAVLGNHDHMGNVAAQVEYSAINTRWRMPAFYYKESFGPPGRPLVDVFCLDTTPLHVGERSARNQLLWLEERLTSSKARWRVVAGHHPLLSGGTSGSLVRSRKELTELFERYRVHVYLSGHDHDLELLHAPGGWLQVVSGSNSRPRKVGWLEESLLVSDEPGYVRVTATLDDLYLEYVTVQRGVCATFSLSSLGVLLASATR